MSDDFLLDTSHSGKKLLHIWRWNLASQTALAELDYDWIAPREELGSYERLAPFADKIRGLWCPSDKVPLSGLGCLQALEHIVLRTGFEWVHCDYRTLPKLRRFECDYGVALKPEFINAGTLTHLDIKSFPKLKSLESLGALSALKHCSLRGAPLTSLAGIAQFASLQELHLGHCRSVTSVDQLTALARLEAFESWGNLKLESYAALAGLPSLRWAYIHSKKAVLPDLGYLQHLPQLQYAHVFVSTSTVDLKHLASHPMLSEFAFYTHAGYALPSEQEIKSALEQNGRVVEHVQRFPKDTFPALMVRFAPLPQAAQAPLMYRRQFFD